jgi:4'-phosphopantetheinyl transferase EntD
MREEDIDAAHWPQADGCALPVHWTRFAAAAFTPARFDAAGLPCPGHIAGAVSRRQAEYFHGRMCARAALRAAGVPPIAVPTGPQREPVWPPGVVGSITHSRQAAAAIVLPAAAWRGVGLDMEEIAAPDAHAALRALVVNPREYALLEAAAGADLAVPLTAVFSAKESFFKAVFGVVRRHIDFDAIVLDAIDLPARTLSFTVRQALTSEFAPGTRLRVTYTLLAHGDIATLYAW